MDKRQARVAHEALARTLAKTSPDAAARRFQKHILNWAQDLAARQGFYTAVIEAALPTMPPDYADALRRLWEGQKQYMNATTDAERAAIDAWLEPLSNQAPPPGHSGWLDALQDCEGGYFTDAIDAELGELVQIPGFDEALNALEWPDA
jgi:hypothetical protein